MKIYWNFFRKNLLCFSSNICNKHIHTINYFYTSISIASYSGLPVNEFRHQEKTTKWAVLRIEITAKSENLPNTILIESCENTSKLCENALLYNSDDHKLTN